MRHKLLLIALFAVSVTTAWSQQVRKATETFGADFEMRFVGDYNYQYILQENGEKLKDGPFTMKATLDEVVDYDDTTVAVKGNYDLKGNHSEGYLDGPLTMDGSMTLKASSGEKEGATYTFRGNFKRGLPDGNFTVSYPSYRTEVDVNYKDGILVGAYSVTAPDTDGLIFSLSGSLTDEGQFTGVWDYKVGMGSSQTTYLNGIVTNSDDYDDALVERAMEYASGSLTEEDLLGENIVVHRDSLNLGEIAWSYILHDGMPFEDMGSYSFSQSSLVGFAYLDRLVTLSEEGYEKMKEEVADAVRTNRCSYSDTFGYTQSMEFDEACQMYYASVHQQHELSTYCIGDPDWSNYSVDVYFTKEQLAELLQIIHQARMESIDTLPFSEIEVYFSDVNTIFKTFSTCEYDENVVVFEMHDTIAYYSRDKFENYCIAQDIDLENLVDNSPEARHEAIREKAAKRAEEIAQACKKLAVDWLSGEVLISYKNLVCTEVPKRDLPVVAYELKEVQKIDKSHYAISATLDIAVEAITTTNRNTARYKTFDMAIYITRKQDDMAIDFDATLQSSNFVNVKNDYDVIDELDAKISANEVDIRALDREIYNAYKSYVNVVNANLPEGDLKGIIAAKEGLLETQKGIVEFVELRKKIVEDDGAIAADYATNKPLVKSYKKYCDARDMSWSAESNIDKLQRYMDVQSGVRQYVQKIAEIAALDDNIANKCAERKDVHKAYLKYKKSLDFSWTAEYQTDKFDGFVELQNSVMTFVDRLDEIQSNDDIIDEEYSNYKDINKAYAAHCKTRDLTWSADKGIAVLDDYIDIQKRCMEFVELRAKVLDNHESIVELKSTASAIYKVYVAYYKGCNLAWSANVDFATIDALLSVQHLYLQAIANPDIANINKQVKKQKITDLDKIFEMAGVK